MEAAPARRRRASVTSRRRCATAARRDADRQPFDTGLVFTRENGEGLHPKRITQAFGFAVDRAQLPRIRFHDLRHSSATAALEAGEDLKVVSAGLGHAGYSITADLYQHVSRHTDQAASDRVANHILGR